MTMQPLNFPLDGRIVGAAPDRPGATIQDCDLVSRDFVVFGRDPHKQIEMKLYKLEQSHYI